MEQQSLFDKFHLDEAWDSPHNIKLLSEIPAIYKGPQPAESTATPYQRLVGDDATFKPNRKILMVEMVGGTENTFHVVESSEPVPWTKPADIAYSKKSPLPKLGFF